MLQFLIRMSILLFSIFLSSCGSTHDSNLERMLATRLIDFKQSNETSLDLTPIFGNQWEKICIQDPYMEQEYFEKHVAKKVRHYEYIADDFYTWWIFYGDGTAKWVQVNRAKVMDKHDKLGTQCTSLKNPRIYVANRSGVRSYYFNDKQEEQK